MSKDLTNSIELNEIKLQELEELINSSEKLKETAKALFFKNINVKITERQEINEKFTRLKKERRCQMIKFHFMDLSIEDQATLLFWLTNFYKENEKLER